MVLSLFGLDVQKSITKTINKTVNNFAAENNAVCAADVDQKLNILIEDSIVEIGNDFKAEQLARLNFRCIQQQQNSADLLAKLTAKLKESIKSDVKKALISGYEIGVQDIETKVNNIVERNVKFDSEQVCSAKAKQDIDFNLIRSQFRAGCSAALIEANRSTCEAAIAKLPANADIKQIGGIPQCRALEKCVTAGNVSIGQVVELSAACDQLQTIAVQIADELENIVEKDVTRKQRPGELFSIPTEVIIIIIVGVVLVGIIGLVITIVRQQQLKQQKELTKKPKSSLWKSTQPQ